MDTKKLLIIGAVVVVLGGAWWALSNQSYKDDAMISATGGKKDDAMMKGGETTMTKDIIVAMGALNASVQTGKATFSDVNGKTKVTVEILSGVADIPQPSHIHAGSCPTPGAITYPLSAIVNGKAETILDVSL